MAANNPPAAATQTVEEALAPLKGYRNELTKYPDKDQPYQQISTWMTLNRNKLIMAGCTNETTMAVFITLYGLAGQQQTWMSHYLLDDFTAINDKHPLYSTKNLQSTLEQLSGEDTDRKRRAYNSLRNLVQRDSVQQYNQEFELLRGQCADDVKDAKNFLIGYYQQGLKPKYAQILAQQLDMESWDLEQWKTKARALEKNEELLRRETAVPRASTMDWSKPPKHMHFNQTPALRTRDINAMDVDVIRTKGGNNVNKNERRCYNCQRFGHFARECRAPKQPQTYRQNQSQHRPNRGKPFKPNNRPWQNKRPQQSRLREIGFDGEDKEEDDTSTESTTDEPKTTTLETNTIPSSRTQNF
jgi:hypothetical protein